MSEPVPAPTAAHGRNHGPNGRFVAGNQAARTHGLRAAFRPPDLRLTEDQVRDGILSDLGGVDALSTLETLYVRRLTDLDITIRMLIAFLSREGLTSRSGGAAYDRLLSACLAFDRLAQRLGLERRAKAVPSLSDLMDGAADA